MLNKLKENSRTRLAKNKNFQYFLDHRKVDQANKPTEKFEKSPKQNNFGVEDLQMNEAVEIVKDMIYLKKEYFFAK